MTIKRNNRKKFIIILGIILSIILLFLIIIASISLYQESKNQELLEQQREVVKKYSSISDFQSIQEVALYLDCKLIKTEESEQENVKYNIKMSIKISPEEENAKEFYEKLVQYSAYVLKYENFYIVDDDNKITVLVLCDKEHESVINYYINNELNYFKKFETKNEISNSTEIENIKLEIQSDVLKNIIKNDWKISQEIGTVETSFNKYDLYFDEGFQIRKINGKIFNIIFNQNYKEKIINNITTNFSKNEVIETLGKPQFEAGDLIGYKAENMYVFFFDSEISIYKIEKYDTEKIAEFMDQYNEEVNFEKLTDQVKEVWKDYDIYEYSENSMILQYTTKGIAFKYGFDNNNGIYLYNNYIGNVSSLDTLQSVIKNKLSLPNNMYYSDKDLTFLMEKQRIETKYDSSEFNNYASDVILNISKKFKIAKNKNGEKYDIKIISINNIYPNSELKEEITKGIWYNDDILIYSIKNSGIYVYNAIQRNYKTIISGTGDYIIQEIKDGKLYYDDTYIKLEI